MTIYPFKGLPLAPTRGRPEPDAIGWNVFDNDTDFPLMVLKRDALESNLRLMAEYCASRGVSLSPHGKTTMSPQLFASQLEAGAWGITVANIWQCRVARAFGVERILIANEVVDPSAIRWLAHAVGEDPGFDTYFLVDSLRGVDILEDTLGAASGVHLQVLVELGYPGGRSGCRTREEAREVAERVSRSQVASLRGVSGFEGLMKAPAGRSVLPAIHDFLSEMWLLASELQKHYPDPAGREFIVSAGGSSYFDLVVEHLGPSAFDGPVRTVLRSGCYLTHDSGMYAETSPLADRKADRVGEQLMAALELWATVLSRPEAELAIVGFGKRDAPYDYRPPVPLRIHERKTRAERQIDGSWEYIDLNDQHAFLRVPANDPLAVGDHVVSGINHPCGVFDKWRVIPVVDPTYTVIDQVTSYL